MELNLNGGFKMKAKKGMPKRDGSGKGKKANIGRGGCLKKRK